MENIGSGWRGIMGKDEIIIKTKEIDETKKKTIQKWPKVVIIILN